MLLVKTILKPAGNKGLGVFLNEDVKVGTNIWLEDSNFHKIYSEEDVKKMMPIQREFIKKYATKEANGTWFLDLDDTRFLNHSDKPNMEFSENNDFAFAARDIEIGEELTCNYLKFMLPGSKLTFVDVEKQN